MKRKAQPTQFVYKNGRFCHHGGPIRRLERDKNKSVVAQTVNKTRYNKIQLARKLRLASYVPAPRLVKTPHFTNPIIMKAS